MTTRKELVAALQSSVLGLGMRGGIKVLDEFVALQ